jgi:hypothetical protein
MHDQLHAARQSFIDSIVLPPFEGAAILYGAAHLTLVRSDRREGVEEGDDGDGTRAMSLRVLEFEALESSAPPASVRGRPRSHRRSSATARTPRLAA